MDKRKRRLTHERQSTKNETPPRTRERGVYRIDLPDEGEVIYTFYSGAGRRIASCHLNLEAATALVYEWMERMLDVLDPAIRRSASAAPRLALMRSEQCGARDADG